MSNAALGSTVLMVLIGLLLIAVAAGFAADVIVKNAHKIDVEVLGRTFHVRMGWLFVAGMLALAVFMIGVSLVVRGVRASRRRKSMLREAEWAARERDQLAQQLAAERESSGEVVKVIRGEDDASPIEHREENADAVPSSFD
jgi:hypothetical protein